MALEDYNISNIFELFVDYTAPTGADVMGSPLSLGVVEVINDDNFGSPTSLGVIELINSDNFGSPISAIFDPLQTDNFGAPAIISASGLTENLVQGDIIYRAQQGRIFTDTLGLQGDLRPTQLSGLIRTQSHGLSLVDHSSSGTLDASLSSTVNINSSAAGPIKLSLPSDAPLGTKFKFIRTGPELRIDAQDSGVIRYSSGNALEVSITSNSKLDLIADGSGSWTASSERGDIEKISSLSYSPAISNPSGVSGLVLWLDADDASTITTVGSGISLWADKSIEGNDFSQGTAANRPIIASGVANGKNGVEFIRSSLANMSASTILTGPPFTIFVVAENSDVVTSHTSFAFVDFSSDIDYHRLAYRQVDPASVVFESRDGTNVRAFSVGFAPANERHIQLGQAIATNSRRVKFNNFGSGTENTDITPDNIDGASIGVLLRNTPAAYMDGKLYEVLVYNRVLTELEETQVINYLATKWDVAL